MRVSVAFGLTGLFAADRGVGLVGEFCLELGQQFSVGGAAGVGGSGEQLLEFLVVLHTRRQNDL